MSTKRDITKKEAQLYAKARKKEKGIILDRLTTEIGWSRANARRQLQHALQRRGPARLIHRKPRARKYSYDALQVLQHLYLISGQPCGKYLAVSLPMILDNLEKHPDTFFTKNHHRYTPLSKLTEK